LTSCLYRYALIPIVRKQLSRKQDKNFAWSKTRNHARGSQAPHQSVQTQAKFGNARAHVTAVGIAHIVRYELDAPRVRPRALAFQLGRAEHVAARSPCSHHRMLGDGTKKKRIARNHCNTKTREPWMRTCKPNHVTQSSKSAASPQTSTTRPRRIRGRPIDFAKN